MVATRTETSDVEITGTRRTMRVGIAMRTFFAFGARLPHFLIRKIDRSAKKVEYLFFPEGDERVGARFPSSHPIAASRVRHAEWLMEDGSRVPTA